MLELAVLAGIILGLILLGSFLEFVFLLLLWPLKLAFALVAGLFKLILLPFQIVGGLLFAVIVLPLLILGIIAAVTVGLPVVLILGVVLFVWIVGSLLACIGGALLGG